LLSVHIVNEKGQDSVRTIMPSLDNSASSFSFLLTLTEGWHAPMSLSGWIELLVALYTTRCTLASLKNTIHYTNLACAAFRRQSLLSPCKYHLPSTPFCSAVASLVLYVYCAHTRCAQNLSWHQGPTSTSLVLQPTQLEIIMCAAVHFDLLYQHAGACSGKLAVATIGVTPGVLQTSSSV
jgi:hypothetical protein